MQYLMMILLFVSALFLILLILIQRGKGGGLAGAFGGMGGQSAFGTKAGDMFTKITIVTAALWIFLCIASVGLLGSGEEMLDADMGGKVPVEDGVGGAAPAEDGDGAGGAEPAPKKDE